MVTVNEISVVTGSSALLACPSNGIPTPTIHWERNGRRVDINGHKYQLHSDGTLQINNVQVDDSGEYQCVAINRGGRDTADISLDVQCKVQLSLVYLPSTTVRFLLSCSLY